MLFDKDTQTGSGALFKGCQLEARVVGSVYFLRERLKRTRLPNTLVITNIMVPCA